MGTCSPLDKDNALIGGDNDRRDELVEPISQVGKSSTGNSTVGQLGRLNLPDHYNKLVIPLGNVSDSIFVMVQLAIREVLDVDTKGEVLDYEDTL